MEAIDDMFQVVYTSSNHTADSRHSLTPAYVMDTTAHFRISNIV